MRPLPTLQADVPLPLRVCTEPTTLSRRGFVSAAAWSLIGATLAGACGGGDGGPTGTGGGGTPNTGGGITVNGGVITIDLAEQTGLAAANGFLLLSQARTIGINTGGNAYRAFTSVCTHEQCDVNGFSAGRIRCPCHGSQFDTSGRVVVGPATLPLTEYRTTYDAATRTVTVARG